MSDIKLVEIEPIEFRYSGRNKYPAIVWYRNIKISKKLNQFVIDKIIKELKSKKRVQTIKNPDNILYWQYPKPLKPLIILDLRTYPITICTSDGTIEHFGLERCERQASIVLRILKKYGYATFRRVTVSTYRIGETSEERKRIFTLFESMMVRKRLEE